MHRLYRPRVCILSRLRVNNLLIRRTGNDILNRLVAELEILLDGDTVLDAHEDDGGGDEEGGGEAAPGGAEDCVEGLFDAVKTPEDGGTSRLDALVEA